jgi:hypothetical protein
MIIQSENLLQTSRLKQKLISEFFLVGGFYSGAKFKFLELESQLYPSWTKIKEKTESYREFTLNNRILGVLDFNPISLYKEYKETQEYCQSQSTINEFNSQIQEAKPRVIAAHSMGCFLVENWIKKLKSDGQSIPDFVSKIIYYQSDSRTVSDSMIENHYSPIDLMLLISTLVNGSTPVGLVPNLQHIRNTKLHPSVPRAIKGILPVDLHTDTINNINHQDI